MVSLAGVVASVGTFLLLAVFLSVTAFLAARNVLGDAPPTRALLVGPVPAVVAFVFRVLDTVVLPDAMTLGGSFVTVTVPTETAVPLTALVVAVVLDVAAIAYAYDVEWRLAGYVGFIHLVITVILGTALGGMLFLLSSVPG
jgi:hypothetical protein